MAFDINAIRAKLKGLEEGKPKSRRWKPQDEHTIRCLPLPLEEDIALILKWHYGVDAGRQMACPTTWGDECPFCDLGKRLKSWKDEHGHDKPKSVREMDWEFFKKIDAAVKHYIPVIVRKKDSTDVEGPFLWELTPTTYLAVMKVLAKDDYNDDHPEGGGLRILTSLSHGLDLTVVLKKPGEKGNLKPFPLTEIDERRKFTPIFKNGDGGEQRARVLLENIPSLSEIAKPVSTAEAEKIFAAYQAGLTTTDLSGSPSADSGLEYSSNSAERPAQGGAGVDETVSRLEALLKQQQ